VIEFMLWKLGIGAVFAFFHGLIYTFITGRPLEPGDSDKEADS
jgi:hypothetical protein